VRVLEQVRRAINFGIKQNLIDPIKFKITLPRLNNEVTEDLNSEQLGRFIKALDEDEDQACANVMRLALFTGMRKTEIMRLAWDAIDFDRGFISIRDPKGGKDQTIPLNASARAVLEKHPRTKGSPWIFPGRRKGLPITSFKKSVDRIRKAAQLPKGFRPMHGLRHVFASMLASSGAVDMFTLQKLLTHKSPLMTQRYAHLRDETTRRASELASEIVANTPKPKEEAVNEN
jgi:integrase